MESLPPDTETTASESRVDTGTEADWAGTEWAPDGGTKATVNETSRRRTANNRQSDVTGFFLPSRLAGKNHVRTSGGWLLTTGFVGWVAPQVGSGG